MFGKKNQSPTAKADVKEALQEMAKEAGGAELDSPWFRANLAFLDTYLRLGKQVSNWQRQALLQAIVSLAAVCWIGYLATLPKIIPYVVEVDQLGRVRLVYKLTENDTRLDPERIIVAEMKETIENLRMVTTDRIANNINLNRGLSRLSGAALNYARVELRKAPPNELGASKTVEIKTYPPLKISNGNWQIEWDETSFSLVGEQIGKPERWKAVMQIRLIPPVDDEDRFKVNPYGFEGYELNWTKIEGVYK